VNTAVFKAFNQKGISIPYPQMDVHLHKWSIEIDAAYEPSFEVAFFIYTAYIAT
jgi:small-conductance mechanosensitive channel